MEFKLNLKLRQEKIQNDIFLLNELSDEHREFNIPSNCFFLGAGCSYSSGIPLGSKVIDICKKLAFKNVTSADSSLRQNKAETLDLYLKRLDEFINGRKEEFDKFVKDKEDGFKNKLNKENLTSGLPDNIKLKVAKDENLAGDKLNDRLFDIFKDYFHKDGLYGNWLEEFDQDKRERQRLIEDLMENKRPDGAYYYFSNFIQSRKIHNVFTVNFDDLLNEALLKYMDIKARVFSQNEIASYISTTSLRPNIIKLHGDYSFENIQNSTMETYNLQPNMEKKLEETLSRFGLVVVGYNGADHSVMKVLEKIKMKDDKNFLLMWCGSNPDKLHWRVINLINETSNSYFIQIQDFESLVSKLYVQWKTTARDIVEIAKESKEDIDKFKSKFIDIVNKKIDVTDSEKTQINNLAEADKYFDKAFSEPEDNKKIELYSKAIELNPNYAAAYNNRAIIYDKLDKNDKALDDYNKAVEINPNYELALNNRGAVYDKIDENKKALYDFNKAIELNPNYTNAYIGRGNIYLKLNENEKALADYNKAIELNPISDLAFYNKGVLQGKLNDNSQAFELYSEAIRLNPEYADAYYNRGVIYFDNKEYEKSIEDFSQAIRIKPKYIDAYIWRGLIYLKQKNYDKAKTDYLKVIELEPDNYSSYISLAEVFILNSDYEKALKALDETKGNIKEKNYELIFYFLKSVVLKFLDRDAFGAEEHFNELMKEDINVKWSFNEIEEYLKDNNKLDKEKRKYIEDKIKLLKEKQKK